MIGIESWTWMVGVAGIMWLGVLLSPWRPWSTRERLHVPPTWAGERDLSDVTVLIPARNEAQVIGATLAGIARQGPGLRVVIVDDASDDGTADVARRAGLRRLRVIRGQALPPGWTGKLWALEQGRLQVQTPYVLLLDADIQLAPHAVPVMLAAMQRDHIQFLSLMASLRMESFWERMLMPAFVFFFKLLYPFRLANSRSGWIAAAAGGCILTERRVLDAIGGFGAIRGALIDDCSLAHQVKQAGFTTWIGLSRDVVSLRPYPDLGSIWSMVARTAFTQLDYSLSWLAVASIALVVAFIVPMSALTVPSTSVRILGAGAGLAMMLSYWPTLRFYERSPLWAFTLPVIGALYLAMTWTSAWQHWCGRGAEWKARAYGR